MTAVNVGDNTEKNVPVAEKSSEGLLRSTLGGAGWLGLGAGITKASQTVVLLILAGLLAPSAMGVLAIGALVLNVTSAVTDLGSSTALVYWRGDVERAARSALTVAVVLALALTGAVWLAAPALADALRVGSDGADVMRGLMLCLPFYGVAGVSQELLRRDLAFRRRVLPDIVGSVTGAIVSVVLASAGHGVTSLVVGQLVQAVLVMLLCWAMRPPVRPGWNLSDLAGLVSYGGHLAGANILQLMMLNVDYLIVAHVLGSESLGIYSMAFRLAYMPFLLVSMVICGAAFAHLCRLDGAAVGRAATQIAVLLTMLSVPLYLGMVLLADQIELLGDQWAPGVPGLRLLALYGLVLSLVHLAVVMLNAVSRTRDGFVLTLLHLVLLTALLLLWARHGITMVAVAQLTAGLGMLGAALFVLPRRVTGLSWRRYGARLAPIALGCVLMFMVSLGARALLPWSTVSYVGLALVGTTMLIAYAVPVVWSARRHGFVPAGLIGGSS